MLLIFQIHQSDYLSQHKSSADNPPGGHPIKTCSVETEQVGTITPGPLVPTEVHKLPAIQKSSNLGDAGTRWGQTVSGSWM